MKDEDRGCEPRARDGESASSLAEPSSGAVVDVARGPMNRHARALRLSLELRLRATVDATGWLRNDAQIFYRRAGDGTIAPFAVLVGSDAVDADLTGTHGIKARCRQYNARVRRVRQLADRLTSLSHVATKLSRATALHRAQRELSELRAMITWRQRTHMPRRAVLFKQLGAEIDFLECCVEHLSRLVDEAEAERASGQAVGPTSIALPSPSPRLAGWRRWVPWRNGAE